MRLRCVFLAAALAAAVLSPAEAQEWRGGKARVDGVVKNDKGEPVQGCKVALRWGRSDRGGPDLTTVFVTSTNGHFFKAQTDRVGWAMYP